jgi:amino acid transporter
MKNSESSNPIFLRESSGFVRGFNWWDVLVFNILGYATGLSLATNPTILGGLYPDAEIYWVLIFGVILSIFSGLNYGLFAAFIPRSGGDYVYISRTLNPALGFVANWGFTWSQIYGIGVFSGWAVRDALSPAFTTYGYTIGNQDWVNVGHTLAQPNMIFLFGCILLLICLVVSVLGLNPLKKFLNVFFLIAFVSTILMINSFVNSSHEEFVMKFNEFMQKGTGMRNAYDGIIALAVKEGYQTGQQTSILSSFLALPIGFLIFFGFTYSVYVGGEVKEPQKSQSIGIIGALILGFFFSWIGMGSYYNVVGRDFNNAIAIVKNLPNSPLPAGGSMIFFAGVLTENPVISFVMNFGSFLWFFLLPVVMTQICIRNVFAWAFDRVLPPWFGQVSSGNRVWHATFAVVIPAVLCLALDSLIGFPYVNYVTLFSLCFCISGIAGMLFPFRRKDIFSMGPVLARRSILGIPLLSIAGAVSAVMFAIILYSSLTNTAFSGVQAGTVPHIVLIIVYVTGLILWWYRRKVNVQKGGPDPHLLFENLPPE